MSLATYTPDFATYLATARNRFAALDAALDAALEHGEIEAIGDDDAASPAEAIEAIGGTVIATGDAGEVVVGQVGSRVVVVCDANGPAGVWV